MDDGTFWPEQDNCDSTGYAVRGGASASSGVVSLAGAGS